MLRCEKNCGGRPYDCPNCDTVAAGPLDQFYQNKIVALAAENAGLKEWLEEAKAVEVESDKECEAMADAVGWHGYDEQSHVDPVQFAKNLRAERDRYKKALEEAYQHWVPSPGILRFPDGRCRSLYDHIAAALAGPEKNKP